MRARMAAWLTRRLYREPVIADVPRSKLYYLAAYGNPSRWVNYLRARADHRALRTAPASRPYVLRAEPFSRCNLHCPLCPTGRGEVGREAVAMEPEALDAILERCGPQLLYVVLWIWGEPLLNKRLAELVRVCKRRNLGVEISSHLSLPLDPERLEAIAASGLDWLIVSNDAASPETYARYRVGGDFHRVIGNLRALAEWRRAHSSPTPFLEWQFVPLRHNEGEMGRAVRLAREVGADGVRFKPARLDKVGGVTFSGSIPQGLLREWAPSDTRLYHAATASRASYLADHCSFLWTSISVYGDGSVAPCCETTERRHDLGNVLRDDLSTIWSGPAYVSARRAALGLPAESTGAASACAGCKVFHKPLKAPRTSGDDLHAPGPAPAHPLAGG